MSVPVGHRNIAGGWAGIEANGKIPSAIVPAGAGSVAVGTASVAFTDGDTARRVTVTDAAVSASSVIACTVRRPDIATDADDAGYIYVANVVLIGSGSFDVVVACLDLSGLDVTANPPSETIVLTYLIG